MEHLKFDDIIEFVSAGEIDDRFLTIFSSVSGHIRECDQCLELVNAIQMLYDEFQLLQSKENFRGYAIARADKDEKLAKAGYGNRMKDDCEKTND